MKTIRVVAAVIKALNENGDSIIFATQRGYGDFKGGWEFPGGKVEKGEMMRQALSRECMEELGIEIETGSIFIEVVHAYPDITVHLTLFNAQIISGEPQLLEHNDIRWITPEEISEYEFCQADEEILKKIKDEWKQA